MSLVEEYIKIQKEYEKINGDRTILLMEVGSFYNIYYVKENENDEMELLENVCSILGMIITAKNRKDLSTVGTLKNPYMAGFPSSPATYIKNKQLLLSNNYSVVTCDQSPGDPSKRVIVDNQSPMTAESVSKNDNINNTNCIMTIYIETVDDLVGNKVEKVNLIVGISYVDVVTGKTYVKELYTNKNDSRFIINELYRILASVRPKEIQLYFNINKRNINVALLEKYFVDNLELNTYPILNISFDIKDQYLDMFYQEQFLNKIFKNNTTGFNNGEIDLQNFKIYLNRASLINIFIELDLDKLRYATISYILMIQYCHDHNNTLLSKIKKPIVDWDENIKKLTLTYNAIVQLNLVPSNLSKINYRINKKKNYDTLLSVIGNCSTTMGKRTIRERLLSPFTEVKILREKYNIIEYLRNERDFSSNCIRQLKELYDIERLNFKLIKENINPKDLVNLFKSYHVIIEILNNCIPHIYDQTSQTFKPLYNIFPDNNSLVGLNNCIKEISQIFNLAILEKCNISDNCLNCKECPINIGVYPEFDPQQKLLLDYTNRIDLICSHLQNIIAAGANFTVKASSFAIKTKKSASVDDDEDEDIVNMKDLGIYLTTDKSTKLKKKISEIDINLCGNISFESKNSKVRVTSDVINFLCSEILKIRNNLSVGLYPFYKKVLQHINQKYDITSIVDFIIELDIGITNANNSLKFGYHKPIIRENPDEKERNINSFLEIKNMRHPLIERIINTEFVSNDISLNVTHNGLLLYGCNSTGKTVLATSPAEIIDMAQAGMYTSGELTYFPYTNIITRLSGQDDQLKGHSSYVVEMLELRTILRNSNNRTLVIGDELCRGTESLSGSSITIATLEELTKRNVSFIFSTHLHDIPYKKRIQDLLSNGKLSINHLESTYDPKTGNLIYNRKLKNGSGESIYGLEVARSLDIDSNFIKNAEDIRKELITSFSVNGKGPEYGKGPKELNDLISGKKTRYNKNMYVEDCCMCKDDKFIEIHHIKEQFKADDNGLIGTTHKNSLGNLLPLCKEHHAYIHSNKLKFVPTLTAQGTFLSLQHE